MACILLDVDGVLHVSGEPIPGAAEAVARLYGLTIDDPALTGMAVEPAPRRALGDLAVPLAFELARRLRRVRRRAPQRSAWRGRVIPTISSWRRRSSSRPERPRFRAS